MTSHVAYAAPTAGGIPLTQKRFKAQKRSGVIRDICWNLLLISVGSTIAAVGVNGILIPHQFVSGGITGIALALHYLFPRFPASALYFLLNVPIFMLGWAFLGRRFFFYSLVGMVIFTVTLQWVYIPMPVHDKILAAILAGIIVGTGSGITLWSKGSAGGTDIFSVILMNRFSIRVGTTSLAFNIIVLTSAALLFSFDAALYSLIYLYVTSHVINTVLTGLSKRKAIFIISNRWREINQKVLSELSRGVTVIEGQGGFSGQSEQILFTVISLRELSRLKSIVRATDPNAFVVVQDTLEVMGRRIGNQPHW
jgi:uncharacterized membrane-anchored protein YitT (DUF2179 family)